MLESNRKRVQNLTGLETWLMIVGRGFVAFGAGVLAVTYAPAGAWPAIGVGVILLVVASRGMFGKSRKS